MTTPSGLDAARVVVDTDLVIDFLRGRGAGMCIRYRMPFATRNREHFDRVDGLDLVDLPEEQAR